MIWFSLNSETEKSSPAHAYFVMFALRLSDLAMALLLAFVASIWPCVLSGFYFVSLLLLCSWWASHWPLRRRVYNTFKLMLTSYCALHIVLLYVYQMFVQVPYFKHQMGVDASQDGSTIVSGNSSFELTIRCKCNCFVFIFACFPTYLLV